MALIEFENLPSTDTPINAENLNNNFNYLDGRIDDFSSNILNLVCPIGKVEVFFDNNDHSNYLGFTWERTSIGKVPVGIDSNDSDFDTIGETGGEKKHTLTIDEMPAHNHQFNDGSANKDVFAGFVWTGGNDASQTGGARAYANLSIAPKGGSQAHNNLQPYQVMAFWKRVS